MTFLPGQHASNGSRVPYLPIIGQNYAMREEIASKNGNIVYATGKIKVS